MAILTVKYQEILLPQVSQGLPTFPGGESWDPHRTICTDVMLFLKLKQHKKSRSCCSNKILLIVYFFKYVLGKSQNETAKPPGQR
jgi:hypothetical protein